MSITPPLHPLVSCRPATFTLHAVFCPSPHCRLRTLHTSTHHAFIRRTCPAAARCTSFAVIAVQFILPPNARTVPTPRHARIIRCHLVRREPILFRHTQSRSHVAAKHPTHTWLPPRSSRPPRPSPAHPAYPPTRRLRHHHRRHRLHPHRPTDTDNQPTDTEADTRTNHARPSADCARASSTVCRGRVGCTLPPRLHHRRQYQYPRRCQ